MARASRHSTADGGAALAQLAEDFEAGRFERVVEHAKRALEKDPQAAAVMHYRAAAELELGHLEEAHAWYEKALRRAPDDAEIVLGMADLLICHPGEDRSQIEQGLELCRRGAKLSRKQDDEELLFELEMLAGIASNQLGECEQALTHLDEALRLDAGSLDARLERGIALFELCRLPAAQRELERVAEEAPDEGWAHHYLGLIAERKGDPKEAKRRFQRAQSLAPEDFPPPVKLGDGEFDAAVEDAVRRLPEHVKKYLENTTVSVEPIPADEDLLASRPPLSPSILGVFRGTPVGERSVSQAQDHFPAAIVLYQRNLERFAKTREELIEQIGITLMHEVGHLIGLDEEDLWERGLE